MTQPLNLPDGYYELPKGKLANVVTCLEMLAKPPAKDTHLADGFSLCRFSGKDLAEFRALFKAVGEDSMWFSRLFVADEKLAEILDNTDRVLCALPKSKANWPARTQFRRYA